jgi:nicotinamide-nucleotide amidase
MKASIISVGTELLTGQVPDVSFLHIIKKLTDLGLSLAFRATVADDEKQIEVVVRSALSRTDIVVVVGGLGSAPDDLTRNAIAEAFSSRFKINDLLLVRVKERLASSGKPASVTEAKDAFAPEISTPIENPVGTVPGFILEDGGKLLVALPDSPSEASLMLEESLAPFLKGRYRPKEFTKHRLLKACGVSASEIMEAVGDLSRAGTNPSLGLWTGLGEVGVRITASAPDFKSAQEIIEEMESRVLERLGDYVYGTDSQTLEEVVGYLLDMRRLTITAAESCTGGLIAHRLTSVSGSSRYFVGGITAYRNEAKMELLNVPEAALEERGEVSEETTVFMANGVRESLGADLGLGLTGIAEPTGGTPEKPLGLVFIALSHAGGTDCQKYNFSGSREEIKYLSSQMALEMVRRFILGVR